MANAALAWGFIFLILICWFVALLLTAMLGVPIGLGIAHVLRSWRIETVWSYGISGVLVGGAVPLLVRANELVLPSALTGMLLGLGYWAFEARPGGRGMTYHFCAAVALLASASASAAGSEQIPLIGSEGPTEDACIGVGTIRTLDPDLPIRERPDAYAREKDRLPSATLVWICDKGEDADGEDWQGIVYPAGEHQKLGDCRVSRSIAAPQPYDGPCSSGWVLARDLRLVEI
jgi:hypothetical protein